MEERRRTRFYQWLAVVFLIAGPLFQYIEQWITPNVDSSTLAAMLPGIAHNPHAYLLTSIVGYFGGALYFPLFIVLFHLTKGRSPILAHIAVTTGFFGALGSASMHVVQILQYLMVQPGLDATQMQKLLNHVENGPFAALVLPMFMIGMFGSMVLMVIALWKSKSVPRIPVVLIVLFMIPDFFNLQLVPHQGPFNIHILLLVAFGWIAYRVVTIPEEKWNQPPIQQSIWR